MKKINFVQKQIQWKIFEFTKSPWPMPKRVDLIFRIHLRNRWQVQNYTLKLITKRKYEILLK